MANGKIPNFNNKFYGDKLVEVTFPDSTGSLGFDEYNATLNNVNSSITSSKIMDADYALNARIPTNNDRLISGTAQRMEIQDSNYSSVAWTSPRYVGSKTISATYNDYQASGSSVRFADGTTGTWKGDQVFDEYPGDETFTRGNPLGKVPAIDLYSTHFVLFDRIQIDEAFADGDIFHCLYLIDDQGNKQPLTYRNKNLVDLQRIFVKGSNAEVLFLGQNNQEVLDEYPIIEVGRLTSTRASFTNDVFKLNGTDYEPNFISTETAVSNAYIRHTFINDRQTDYTVRFVPSAFNVENIGTDSYRLTYSKTDIRNSIINNPTPNEQWPFRHSYFRKARISSLNNPNSYVFSDGSSSLNMEPQNHDSKFDPFYFLTWNPKTSKIFENTLLEQKVDWNLYTPDPNSLNPPFQLFPGNPSFPTIPSMGSISQYTNEWSPIKIGDAMVFSKFPINQQESTSNIGIFPSQPGEEIIQNFRDYYNVSPNIEIEIEDINYPFSQSIEIVSSFGNEPDFSYQYYDELGNPDGSPDIIERGGWQTFRSQSIIQGITSIFPPDNTSLTTSQSVAYNSLSGGNFSICVDADYYSEGFGFQFATFESAHSIILSVLDRRWAMRRNFIDSLSHGDILEFDFIQGDITDSPTFTSTVNYINDPVRYKILKKPFHPTIPAGINTNVYIIPIQYIPTTRNSPYPSLLNIINQNPTFHPVAGYRFNGFSMYIKRIVKYRAPYLDIKFRQSIGGQTDISGSINSSGSVLSLTGVDIHEQYITSQFLEGSGVGVLIPDNYDPKLREQLPDIINKTGIDVNSLT